MHAHVGFCTPSTWTTRSITNHIIPTVNPTTTIAGRHAIAKRTRRHLSLSSRSYSCPCYRHNTNTISTMTTGGEIEGGELPEWNDPTPEVEYFGGSTSSSASSGKAPEFLPSSLSQATDYQELPLFPLELVLAPGGQQSLHIFEPRYRLMFNRLHDEGDGKFGIVMTGERMASIGCTAEITQFKPLPDGRILTNNIGRNRFRIVRIVEEKPYIIAKVAPLKDDIPTENTMPIAIDVWTAVQDVLRLSNKLYEKSLELSPDLMRINPGPDGKGLKPTKKTYDSEKEGEKDIPEGWPSPSLVEEYSFAVSQILDMPLKDQQIMLQTTNTAVRLRRQLSVLSTARQYLAAQVTIKEAGLKGF